MAAVKEQDVLELLGGSSLIGEDVNLAPFLDAAAIIVEEDLGTSGLSDKRKALIQKFLAAHFATLAIERGGLTRYQVGESSESYKTGSDSDRGFNLTRYGQQAVSLDSSGTLALNATPKQKAQFRVVLGEC